MDSKEKMSRALGTAFLTHQVAQLEKSAIDGGHNTVYPARSAARGGNQNSGRSRGGGGGTGRGRGRGGFPRHESGSRRADDGDTTPKWMNARKTSISVPEKLADRIVVDSSVLIHALGKVRTWCRDSSKEVIIVPLEALNTLDFLKKGTSRLAIRARNASRLLEAQVGSNPRILVQQDHGYIAWEDVFPSSSPRNRLSTDSTNTVSSSEGDDNNTVLRSSPDRPRSLPSYMAARRSSGEPPEWLKRTICCAKYEDMRSKDSPAASDKDLKVVLAIVSAPPATDKSIQENRYESRAAGSLTCQWAISAGLSVLEIEAEKDDGGPRSGKPARSSVVDDEDDTVPAPGGILPWIGDLSLGDEAANSHRRKHSEDLHGLPSKPWTAAPTPRRTSFGQSGPTAYRGRKPNGGGNLVEKPSAPIPLTNAGRLPAGKVIRLLTRGEKLEP